MDKIIAVVVTYNRKVLLHHVIDSLQSQTINISTIIVVNNGSTDGTKEWLDAQKDLYVIHQGNVGGSGGFFTGIKVASQMDCDWIWCMDDDVFPTDTCLKTLLDYARHNEELGILCPHRLLSGETVHGESKKLNLSNPFKPIYADYLTTKDVEENEISFVESMAFEGPLIQKEVVEKIGLPNKDLFILYDDTDYCYRAILAGYRAVVVRDAIMEKYDFQTKSSYREDKIKNKWKLAYHIRNTAYFGHRYGKNFWVRHFAAMPFLLHMYGAITFNFIKGHKYSFSDYALFWRMMRKGIKEELGIIQQ